MPSTKPTLPNAARRERLRRYAGWTAADLEKFDVAMRAQSIVDARPWNDAGRRSLRLVLEPVRILVSRGMPRRLPCKS